MKQILNMLGVIALFCVGVAWSALTPDSTLNLYSVYGVDYVTKTGGAAANTSPGGAIGSAGDITINSSPIQINNNLTTPKVFKGGSGADGIIGTTNVGAILAGGSGADVYGGDVFIHDSIDWTGAGGGDPHFGGNVSISDAGLINMVTWIQPYFQGVQFTSGASLIVPATTPQPSVSWVPAASLPLIPIFTTAQFPDTAIASGTLDVNIANGASQTLAPGHYKDLFIGFGSTLNLTSDGIGEYSFENVNLSGSDSRIIVDVTSGNRAVIVVNGVMINGSASTANPVLIQTRADMGFGPEDVYGFLILVMHQAGDLNLSGGASGSFKIAATVSVPNAKVLLSSGISLYGQLFAKAVEFTDFQGGTMGEFHPFDPELPTVEMSTALSQPLVISENPTRNIQVPIRLDRKNGMSVSIDYRVIQRNSGVGYAQDGLDYDTTSVGVKGHGTLNIPKETLYPTDSLLIHIIDDAMVESPETLYVQLFNPQKCQLPGKVDTLVLAIVILSDDIGTLPTALPESYSLNEDDSLGIAALGVLANDVNIELSPMTAILKTNAAHGLVTLNADGSFKYVPTANYNGPDSFTYAPHNGIGDGNTVTVAITVISVNDAPVSTPIPDQTILEGGAFTNISLDNYVTDVETPDASILWTKTGGSRLTTTIAALVASIAIPSADWNGIDSVIFTATDANGASFKDTVIFTVTPVNDAPIAITDTFPATEGYNYKIDKLLENDTDVDNLHAELHVSKVWGGVNGTATLLSNDSVLFQPLDYNFNGEASFYYQLSDGAGGLDTALVVVNYAPVNDQPVAKNKTMSLPSWIEDVASITLPFSTVMTGDNDSLDGNAPSTLSLVSVLNDASVVGGTVAIVGSNVVFTPAANFNGNAKFQYIIQDVGTPLPALKDTAWVTLVILPVNDAPVISGQTAVSTAEETAKVITLAMLSVTDVDNTYPTGFSLRVGSGSNYTVSGTTITPALDFVGILTVPVRVFDGTDSSNVFNLSVTVTNVNDAPVITAQTAITTPEETAKAITLAMLLVTDVDNVFPTGFTYRVGTGTNYTVSGTTITPVLNYVGTLTVPVRIFDGTDSSNVFNLSVTVTNVNDAPVITAQSAVTTPEETPKAITLAMLTATDIDNIYPTDFTLRVGTGTNYTVSGTTITPVLNFVGTLTVPVRIFDGTDSSNIFNLSVTVTAVNDAPVVVDHSYSTKEDTRLDIAAPGLKMGGTDVENDAFTTVLVTTPAHGTVTVAADGSFSYMPSKDYNGDDSFTYAGKDADLGVAATVTINMIPVNEPPVATADAYTTAEDVVLNENVTTNDFDMDGFAFAVALVSDVAHGTLVLNPNGSFSYTPAANYNGPDSFTYQLSDAVGSIDTNIVTVSLTVTPVNDVPVALVPSAYAVNEDEVLQVSVSQGLLLGAVDGEGDALTAALVSGATHGVVALLADGSFIYTPEKDFNGMDSFQFVANDGIANSVPVTVTIAVAAVNDAPVIVPQTFSVPEDAGNGTIVGQVVASDVDSGSVLSYSLSEPSSLFTIGVDGTIRLIGALDYEAMTSSTLTVVVSDGFSSAQATITVAVTNVQETSVVQIISVFANDSNWLAPDKVWTNDSLVDLTWSHDGEVISERIGVNLGVNVIIREFKSTSKDTYGRDTVTIYVSRQTPIVDLMLPPERPVPTPGTVIEEPVTAVSSSSDASVSSSSSVLVIDDTKPIFYINKTETEIFGQVIYINKDLQLDTMLIKLDPTLTEGMNVVDYTWTDPFGNTATTSVNVFLDLTAPLVKIVRPADSTIVHQYVAPIIWTVDGHVMDTLNLQSLVVGWNLVIRTYRDRAGNEGSDSIWIQLKDEKKTINISLEDPLVLLNPVKIAEMYAVNPPKDDEFFALSIFNPKTGQEEEKQYGMGTKVTIGDDSEPYPGLSGKHLGPTIRVDAKLPPMGGVDAAGNRRGGDLASIMEPDGSVALTAGAGEDRVMVSLQDYIADHCLADAFKGIPDDQLKNAPLYKALVKVDISIYDAIGQFVDQMGVSQNIEKSDYLNDAASVTMFLELKPHNGQGLRNQRGREYATGVYVLRGAVKSAATLLCDTPNASRGAKTNYTSEILENFGFRRP